MAFDINNQADLTALKTEVETDPFGIGYLSTGLDRTILDRGNSVEANTNGDEVNVPFDEFPIIDAIDEITKPEYDGLSPRDKTIVDTIIQAGVARSDNNGQLGIAYFGPVKKLFRKAFGATSNTWLAVKDDRARPASRFEALFGRDVQITLNDWIAARRNG